MSPTPVPIFLSFIFLPFLILLTKEQKFKDGVKYAEHAAVLVLVY